MEETLPLYVNIGDHKSKWKLLSGFSVAELTIQEKGWHLDLENAHSGNLHKKSTFRDFLSDKELEKYEVYA